MVGICLDFLLCISLVLGQSISDLNNKNLFASKRVIGRADILAVVLTMAPGLVTFTSTT